MSLSVLLMGVLPSIGTLALFVFVVRGVIRADRRERAAISREEHMRQAATTDPE